MRGSMAHLISALKDLVRTPTYVLLLLLLLLLFNPINKSSIYFVNMMIPARWC